jgi:hypothetical protein
VSVAGTAMAVDVTRYASGIRVTNRHSTWVSASASIFVEYDAHSAFLGNALCHLHLCVVPGRVFANSSVGD